MAIKCVALLALLAAATVANAQIQVCNDKIKPGQVSSSSITLGSTTYASSYSSLTVNWPRPNDPAASGGVPSCISEYSVQVFRASDGQQLQSATVPVSPAHTSASYTAKGLSPGAKYQVAVTPKGPAGVGSTGMKSQAFTTAPAPAPAAPACKQPQSVSNIRKTGGSVQGSKATMTVAWNPSSTEKECIKEYAINIYAAGSNSMIKSATVPASSTSYTDSIYEPGKSYEFYIYARNPSAGAMGNGIGLRSAPIQAPLGASGIAPL